MFKNKKRSKTAEKKYYWCGCPSSWELHGRFWHRSEMKEDNGKFFRHEFCDFNYKTRVIQYTEVNA